jgi:hypothetical protein
MATSSTHRQRGKGAAANRSRRAPALASDISRHRGEQRRVSDMKKTKEIRPQEEPVGIVISRGAREEMRPVFAAYVWGPAPDEEVARRDVQAA